MPRVCIIIINFNAGDRLAKVLEALSRQTWRDFNVLIFDNASSDGSENCPRPQGLDVALVRADTNLGFAGGMMAAIAHTDAPWIAALNPDAYPDSDWLAKLVAASDRYGPQTVLGSVQLMADDPEQLDGLGDTYHASGVAWRGGFGKSVKARPNTDKEIFAACFAATLFHRQTFHDHGGLDTDFFCYHEDVDFGFRHRRRGGRAILVHDAVVTHEGSAITGRYSAFTVFHGIRNRQWTLVKNMPWVLMPFALPLYLLFSLAFLIRSYMLGIGFPYVRGWWAGIRDMGPMLKKRKHYGETPLVSAWTIAKAMSWSPIAPLRRAPDLRDIKDPPRP